MKAQYLLLIILITFSCKKNSKPDIKTNENITKEVYSSNDIDTLLQQENINVKSENKTKQLELLKSDLTPKHLILDKHLYEENKKTILDFYYPVLNEKVNENYKNFNTYIKNEVVGVTGAVMLDNEEFISLCDTLETRKQKSVINYAINENVNVISTVFVIENYYSGAAHNSVHFKTVNYNFNTSKIISYVDYFKKDSEQYILKILNSIIKNNINSGDMYYDCWEISETDFETYKNNFSINGNEIRFYFDDCVICPSYTGTYYIEVDKKNLYPYIKSNYYLKQSFKENL